MRRFIGNIPLVATASVEIDARDEDEAMRILEEMVDNYEIEELRDYDAEHKGEWWIDEE